MAQTFTATYSDTNGTADVYETDLLINTTNTSGASACYVSWLSSTNGLYLASDSGGWPTPITPGSSNTLQNSQCTVYGTGSSIALSGNQATMTVRVSFNAAFAGAKFTYLRIFGNQGANYTGMQQMGAWTVNATGYPDMTITKHSRTIGETFMKCIVVVLLTMQLLPAATAAGDDQVVKSVFVKDSEIYITDSGSIHARQLTRDGLPKSRPVLSKNGKRVAFLRDDKSPALANVVIMLADGTSVREIQFRRPEEHVSGMRFVEDLQWVSDQRLVVSGSVNPSTGEYAILDAGTGKQVDGYLVDGSAWAASPDGSHFAYVGYIPHFTPEENRRPQFCLDKECAFDTPFRGYPPGRERHLEFKGAPVWSPDGTAVAIEAENYETQARSVIIRPVGGKALEFAAPPGADGTLQFSWDGNVLVARTGGGLWRLESGAQVFVRMN